MAAYRLFFSLILSLLAANCSLLALTPIFPLKDIRAGQHGIGKTVFSGDKVEEFQVDVLGVLENIGPRQSVILARLSGGPLAHTGVLQGMSGSPVYIDGKLVGAVALAFSYAKEPIAGIRPIEDMLATGEPRTPIAGATVQAAAYYGMRWPAPAPKPENSDLIEISTPLSFNGFTAGTIDHFSAEMRKLGLEPRQGVSSGGEIPPKLGDPRLLHPGDMISVQLLSGDWSIGADGTVTEIDGNRIFAFGHHFLSVGGTELPFARANVIALLSNVATSFKISTAREWMGTITQDKSTSVYGELGRRAVTVPVSIDLRDAQKAMHSYHMQMVSDRILSPFILQMAVYNVIDATERTLGMGTFDLRGDVEFNGNVPPLKLDNTFAGDFGVAQSASIGVASSLGYLMQSGFDALRIKGVHLTIDASEKKHVWQVEQIAVSKKDTHPGDTVELVVTLAGENGAEMLRTLRYKVPVGAPAGALQFTVSDATSANLVDFAQALGVEPKSPNQVVGLLNGLRPNNHAYLRVWRTDASLTVQGTDLPDPPPSVALLIAKSQATPQTTWLGRGSTISQVQIDTGQAVVTGSKTVQVEVKE